MDAIVEAALRKWPNVPHCHGWLALDARGEWYMRDERIQAAGPFPQVKGSRVDHVKLRAFIERNYACDEAGAWFFQNGPQRVYVQLEAAPYVWRVADAPGWPVHSHTGLPATVLSSWLDESGRLFLDTDIGYGLVHTMDMAVAAEAVQAGDVASAGMAGVGSGVLTGVLTGDLNGAWQPQELLFTDMPVRFGYRLVAHH